MNCSSPSNLVVWSLVLLALMEPFAIILIVVARHGAGLHHRAHFVVLVLQVELVPGAIIHLITLLSDYMTIMVLKVCQNDSLPLQY